MHAFYSIYRCSVSCKEESIVGKEEHAGYSSGEKANAAKHYYSRLLFLDG